MVTQGGEEGRHPELFLAFFLVSPGINAATGREKILSVGPCSLPPREKNQQTWVAS
jgi:hypothetical protein